MVFEGETILSVHTIDAIHLISSSLSFQVKEPQLLGSFLLGEPLQHPHYSICVALFLVLRILQYSAIDEGHRYTNRSAFSSHSSFQTWIFFSVASHLNIFPEHSTMTPASFLRLLLAA